jgi:hypothetical protein
MHIIYNCRGGTHSSVSAAAIHLGLVTGEKVLKKEDILLKVPFYDKLTKEDLGKINYIGTDKRGNLVYALGRKGAKNIVLQAIASTLEIYGINPKEEILFVDTMPAVNTKMKIGGFLSRSLGLVSVGRPIVLSGTQDAWQSLDQIVRNTKLKLG